MTRQRELAWNRHFGWRGQDHEFRGSAAPIFPRREFRNAGSGDDPHLRPPTDLISYQVRGVCGFPGVLEDFLLDGASWHINYPVIRAGEWIFHEKLVPSSSVTALSWREGRVIVDRTARAC